MQFQKSKPTISEANLNLDKLANVATPAVADKLASEPFKEPTIVHQAVPAKRDLTIKCKICRATAPGGWGICFDPSWATNSWGGDTHEERAELCPICAEKLVNGNSDPVITLADLMLELEVVGEIFKKRRIYSVLSLKLESGRFTLTCSYKPEEQEMQRYISRFISGSLTPKGLAMVIAELKAGVGI